MIEKCWKWDVAATSYTKSAPFASSWFQNELQKLDIFNPFACICHLLSNKIFEIFMGRRKILSIWLHLPPSLTAIDCLSSVTLNIFFGTWSKPSIVWYICSVNKFLWNRCHVCSSEFYNLKGCLLLPLLSHWFEKISGLFSWLRRVDEPWKNPTPGEGLLLGQAGLPHPLHGGGHEVQSENLQGKRRWNEVSSPECGSF